MVQRAELIAVAHIKDGSIAYVPHTVREGGMSWEYHATLIITSVVKGMCSEQELPIIIHYGLDPLISYEGETHEFPHRIKDASSQTETRPVSSINIYDTASADARISNDIRQDQLWFLRVHNWYKDKLAERDDTTTAPGIWDPEDIQLLELMPYFQAFLSNHPEDKLKEYASGNSSLAVRSQVYLDHLRMEEILKESDAAKRADLLLPFALYTDQRKLGPTQQEAMKKLWQGCGQAGAAALVPIFKDARYEAMQNAILLVWSNANYHDVIPMLVDILKAENASWAKQSPDERDRWVHPQEGHEPLHLQYVSRDCIQMILYLFTSLGDPSTKPIVEETKQCWNQLYPDASHNEIVKSCDNALKNIENAAAKK